MKQKREKADWRGGFHKAARELRWQTETEGEMARIKGKQ